MLTHNSTSNPRIHWLDSLRGAAICMMMSYHFIFDLNQYDWVSVNLYEDPFWLSLRAMIVSLFVWISGISLVIRSSQKSTFFVRWLQISGCALCVSVGSWLMFPKSYIFFGVLHFFCVASVIGMSLRHYPRFNLVLGFVCLTIGLCFQHAFFDQPSWQWLGLMTHKPITEDYVPLLPWFGVYCLGLTSGVWLRLINKPFSVLERLPSPIHLTLQWLGKRSLRVYMLHQPIFLAGLWLFNTLIS